MDNFDFCKHYHDDCVKMQFVKLKSALNYTLKVYSITHGIPLLLFKYKEFQNKPFETIKKYIISVLKSMGFLSTYIMSIRFFMCYVFSKFLGEITCKYI